MQTARDELCLGGPWLFRIGSAERPQARGWHQAGSRPEKWMAVPVPSDWGIYLPELDGYAGHGWYWRTYRLDRE